jgi:hypothetical protein
MRNNLEIVACGTIVFAVAGTPSWAAQRGFQAAITDNGVGDYTLNLDGGNLCADAECCIFVGPNELQAASGMINIGTRWASAQTIQVTCVQEQAGGAASIAYDSTVNVMVLRRKAV